MEEKTRQNKTIQEQIKTTKTTTTTTTDTTQINK